MSSAVTESTFRAVTGTFPSGVTVVTLPPAESPHGLTASAFTGVSLSPPLVLVCLDHGTRSHALLDAGDAHGFCVNVLAADQRDLAEHFAGIEALEADPFDARPTAVRATGAPAFEGALGYLDCSLHEAVPAGDHTVYVGRVEEAAVNREAAPLVHYGGEWSTVDSLDR